MLPGTFVDGTDRPVARRQGFDMVSLQLAPSDDERYLRKGMPKIGKAMDKSSLLNFAPRKKWKKMR